MARNVNLTAQIAETTNGFFFRADRIEVTLSKNELKDLLESALRFLDLEHTATGANYPSLDEQTREWLISRDPE